MDLLPKNLLRNNLSQILLKTPHFAAFFLYCKNKKNIMENKVAYITGGTKGIGLGIAQVLHDHGITVAISARNNEDALSVAEE